MPRRAHAAPLALEVDANLRESRPHAPHRRFLEEHNWRRGNTDLAFSGVYTTWSSMIRNHAINPQ
jgi:hypothetical protein